MKHIAHEYAKTESFIIEALENGVSIIGLTRGEQTKFHHIEKMDKGDVLIVSFTEFTAAIKIRGRARILGANGEIISGG